jgi:hypothetical protein
VIAVACGQRFLRYKRVRFAVPQISWRRTNQFRNFVGVLEFRAIHFDYRPAVSEQNLGRGFDSARFP